MSRSRLGGLWVVLFLFLIVTSVVAWGEVTLHQGESGEAQWWYCEQHTDDETLCFQPHVPPLPAGCLGDEWCAEADHYNVEIAGYFFDAIDPYGGDWAYVSLDTADRFELNDIDGSVDFTYKNVGGYGNNGPSLAYSLVDNGKKYLLISVPADYDTDCMLFSVGATTDGWYYGTWDGTNLDSFQYEAYFTTWANVGTNTTADEIVSYTGDPGNDLVSAVLIAVGIITDGRTGKVFGNPAQPGGAANGISPQKAKVIVDFVQLSWNTTYGGTYKLEPAWPYTVGFDDWTQYPLPNDTDEPLEFMRWCLCEDCMADWDDQNLWNLIFKSTLEGKVPAAATNFPSDPYALYFGDPASGNYDVGEAATGCICSPYNELNPGDEYVTLEFDSFREVEFYDGEFDMTYVQIAFYDHEGAPAWSDLSYDPFGLANPGDCATEWKTVWYKDSRDESVLEWAHETITHYLDADNKPDVDEDRRIVIPSAATRMKIRFCFNSDDAASNNYTGWLIDEIIKTHGPDIFCQIETNSLPQGEVDDKYPKGETNGFQMMPDDVGRWELVSIFKDGEELDTWPERMWMGPDGLIRGLCESGTSGTYEVTLRLLCDTGRPVEKTYILNIIAPTSSESRIYGPEDFDTPVGWQFGNSSTTGVCPNLWHETFQIKRIDEVGTTYGDVAYFGKDDDGATDDPNYKCDRAKGCMTSPIIFYNNEHTGEELIVTFKSWRKVEDFQTGEYDRTWVEVKFEGSGWTTVWEKTSEDPSLAQWTWEDVHTGLLLPGSGRKIQIRFCFDSVDAYSNGADGETWGWVVDEVTLYAGSAELSILGCPREQTSVGEYYDEELRISGGPAGVTPEFEIAGGQLPPGLGLVQAGHDWFLRGVPRTQGRFIFTLKVTVDGSRDTRECTIVVGEEVTLLWEDFEDDPGWALGSLWHFTNDDGVAGVDDLGANNHAAYYGQDDDTAPNYNTGGRTSGMLTLVTPVIDLLNGPGGGPVEGAKVSFDYWREVEPFAGGGYDKTEVQVKLDDGPWETIWQRDSMTMSMREWITEDGIPAFLTDASTMVIRFMFDSVDKWYNNYVGWLVDNIRIVSATDDECQPLSAMGLRARGAEPRGVPAELQVMNIPNPVRDVDTTTFMVRSVAVEAMKIEIYDLSGLLVFEEEIQGNELEWHTVNDYGEYLANGIYLYRAYVRVGGDWLQTDFQKLVILR